MSAEKVTMSMMEKLFLATVAQLTERIQSGSATAADLSAAIKLLKDNNIVLRDDGGDNPMAELEKIIQGFTFDDVEEYSVK